MYGKTCLAKREVLKKASRIREIIEKYNLEIEMAKVVLKMSDEFEVSPEILLRENVTP